MRLNPALSAGTQVSTPGLDAILTIVGICEPNAALMPYWREDRYLVRWTHESREILGTLGRSALTVVPSEAEPAGLSEIEALSCPAADPRTAMQAGWDLAVFGRGA